MLLTTTYICFKLSIKSLSYLQITFQRSTSRPSDIFMVSVCTAQKMNRGYCTKMKFSVLRTSSVNLSKSSVFWAHSLKKSFWAVALVISSLKWTDLAHSPTRNISNTYPKKTIFHTRRKFFYTFWTYFLHWHEKKN